MYCGICIEVCPFDALHWSPEFEYAETDIRDLLHEKERLGQWMQTVPPPPALDPASAEPAEVAAANRPPRTSGLRERPAPRTARTAKASEAAETAPAARAAEASPGQAVEPATEPSPEQAVEPAAEPAAGEQSTTAPAEPTKTESDEP
jgi:NADH-quinone oxidoreductase subunit I